MAEYVMEYDGWADGIPIGEYLRVRDAMHERRREEVVRCRDCRWAHEATPVDEWHLECRVRPLCRHYTPDDGFCHLGEPKVVDEVMDA